MVVNHYLIAGPKDFDNWTTINDTIMGGSSQARCESTSEGLLMKGELIEENGGFVSCRSPVIAPVLDLSDFVGIELDVEGQGQTLKFAISCGDGVTRISDYFSGGIRWVSELKTNKKGNTIIQIPFNDFQPTIRAKPINLPLSFSSNSVQQLQLLYSRFGTGGRRNHEFKTGPFCFYIRSINAYS